MQAVDTQTGDTYYYDDGWIKDRNADAIIQDSLRRKSDPPVEPRPEPKEVEGGCLIPASFKKTILTQIQVSPRWVPYSATIRGVDLEIPCLDKT